ncbi:translation elongation factor 4 [Saccharomonospora iraqiensis]|uniref:translation elongation factor 4 n=1 Tax=Saccharomonospora iraqiensis TaxID=52698 RepID=UPI0003FFB898|nr:translation elongation factor 4 [Saccharomonospora iraqiensis]
MTPTRPSADTTFTPPEFIRNFCIIAHIDHGKSTLADRMLQLTGVVEERTMRDQYLDRMDLERERGITIKAQNVRLPWTRDGREHVLHLIDTPGHVDFTYEVSRALEACEGAILLVDAAQGIEAQTLANLYLALDKDLHIIPVLNKIDLPAAEPDKYAAELAHIIGCEPDDVLRVSAKTGAGVPELLDQVVGQVPPPEGDPDGPPRALIFDSVYDAYRGVVTYIRVVDGRITPRERVTMMHSGATHELLEVGVISPDPKPCEGLGVGEVGYLITGVKDVRQAKVGDTVTTARRGADAPLAGYREPVPMVFSGLYPVDGSDYPDLRDALDKLQLNDAALSYEPETSVALGFGFRCGFLGLLHLEITRARLEREFGLDLIATAPNVVYDVYLEDGSELQVTNPSDWPTGGKIAEVHEPVSKVTVIAPSEFIGAVMELCQGKRGQLLGMDYLSEDRVELRYQLPLGEIIFDFFDSLKSRTRGYASLDYEEAGQQAADLVKVDILLQGETVDAFSAIVHKDFAYPYGNKMTNRLRELIPRQQFEVPIQAAVGGRIIARETVRAIRKDVLAKCYGGDISRKRKLLEKQKEGKKKMKTVGRVEVPQEAFVAALSAGGGDGGDKGEKGKGDKGKGGKGKK